MSCGLCFDDADSAVVDVEKVIGTPMIVLQDELPHCDAKSCVQVGFFRVLDDPTAVSQQSVYVFAGLFFRGHAGLQIRGILASISPNAV